MTIWIPDIDFSRGPIYLSIADAIETDIHTGRLERGERLPPQRELAYKLGVTLGTVTRAYREAERRRLLRGETGRGTFVAPYQELPSPLMPDGETPAGLDLARNYAYAHLNPDLGKALIRMARLPGLERLNGYAPSEGLKIHREAGAELFKLFGVDALPENIALTCGAQHGIQVLLQALFNKGDAIGVDELTYPSLLASAPHLGLRLVPIAMTRTEAGFCRAMCTKSLETACRLHGLKGLFVIPNMQNPTSHTMTGEERKAIAEIARKHGLRIIEDDPYTPFVTRKLASFATLAPELTASIASPSKLAAPGARIGYVHVPADIPAPVRNAIGESTWMASPIMAELVAGWVRDGTVAATIDVKRRANEHRFALACRLLGEEAIQGGPDKVFLWLRLPDGTGPSAVEADLAHRGVSVLASRHFQAAGQERDPFLRVALGTIPNDDAFAQAISELAGAIGRIGQGTHVGQPVG